MVALQWKSTIVAWTANCGLSANLKVQDGSYKTCMESAGWAIKFLMKY